jgi:PAS domain S-box-containing protein
MVASSTTSLWVVIAGLLVAAGGTLSLAFYTAINNDGDRTLDAFTTLLVTVFIWTASYGGRLLASSLGDKLLWQYVLYIGIVGTAVAWLVFALLYSGRTRYLSRLSTAALLVIPVATLLGLITNRFHGQFYEIVSLSYLGQTPILTTTAGPLWWLHFTYAYVLIGLGIAILVTFALTADSLYRAQTIAIILAALFPLTANVLFVFDIPSTSLIDVTPLAFTLSSLVLFIAMFYGRFLDLIPVAQEEVMRTLEDGLLVVDDEGRIIRANSNAEDVIGSAGAATDVVGKELATLEPTLASQPANKAPTPNRAATRGFEASRVTEGNTEWFWVRRVDLSESTEKSGSVVTMTDITEKKRFERRLRKLQRIHQRLMTADNESAIAEIALEAAQQILGLPITGIWKYDTNASTLEPFGMTPDGHEVLDEQPTFEPGESLAWDAFVSGELQAHTDLSEADVLGNPETLLESELLIPIGEWGIMASGSTDKTEFQDIDFDLIRLLAGAIESALDRATRERRIEILQRRTGKFIRAGSTEAIAKAAVDTADEIFGLPLSGIHLRSEDGTRLEATAATDAVRESFGRVPSYTLDGSDGVGPVDRSIWNVLESGESLIIDETDETGGPYEDRPVRSVMIHPLGDHGVFITASPEPNAFDSTDRALAELFAATITATLDRVEREQQLRVREQELRRQNERLEEFTNVVSHDLRSPLNQADIYLELLSEKYDDDRLESAAQANDRATEMIDGLLSLARQGRTVDDPTTDALATPVCGKCSRTCFGTRSITAGRQWQFAWGPSTSERGCSLPTTARGCPRTCATTSSNTATRQTDRALDSGSRS